MLNKVRPELSRQRLGRSMLRQNIIRGRNQIAKKILLTVREDVSFNPSAGTRRIVEKAPHATGVACGAKLLRIRQPGWPARPAAITM
jgi:hypothetical protein